MIQDKVLYFLVIVSFLFRIFKEGLTKQWNTIPQKDKINGLIVAQNARFFLRFFPPNKFHLKPLFCLLP